MVDECELQIQHLLLCIQFFLHNITYVPPKLRFQQVNETTLNKATILTMQEILTKNLPTSNSRRTYCKIWSVSHSDLGSYKILAIAPAA